MCMAEDGVVENRMDEMGEPEPENEDGGVEIRRMYVLSQQAGEEIKQQLSDLDRKIREAIRSAVADVLGDLLEEQIAEFEAKTEQEKEEIEKMVDKPVEIQPKCPPNLNWLKKMFEIFPEEILKKSKLWKYRHCLGGNEP